MSDAKVNVKVVVRCRPMNKTERSLNCGEVVTVDPTKNQVVIAASQTEPEKKVAVQSRATSSNCILSRSSPQLLPPP